VKESGGSGWWVAWIPLLETWAEGFDPAVAEAMAFEGGQGDTCIFTLAVLRQEAGANDAIGRRIRQVQTMHRSPVQLLVRLIRSNHLVFTEAGRKPAS
jgi:hypothetical protein